MVAVGMAFKAVGALHNRAVGGPGETLHRTRLGGAFGSYAMVGLVTLELLGGIGVEGQTYVHPSHKAQLTLEEPIPPQLCLLRAEAQFDGANATKHFKIKSHSGIGVVDSVVNGTVGKIDVASWTEKWSGKLGGIVCPDYTDVQPTWDPTALRPNCDPLTGKPRQVPGSAASADQMTAVKKAAGSKQPAATSIDPECKGAYVVTLNEATMNVHVYDTNPGAGWTSDTGGIAGGQISAWVDQFNGLGFLGHIDLIDNQQNPLRSKVMAKVISQFTDDCLPQAIKDMTADPETTAKDALLEKPRTLSGNLVKFLVQQYNQTLKNMYMREILQQVMPSKNNASNAFAQPTAEQQKQADEIFSKDFANNPKYMVSENDFLVHLVNQGKGLISQYKKYDMPFANLDKSTKDVHVDPKSVDPTCGSPVQANVARQG